MESLYCATQISGVQIQNICQMTVNFTITISTSILMTSKYKKIMRTILTALFFVFKYQLTW